MTAATKAKPTAPPGDLYERDFHAWCFEQARLLREGRTSALDLANVIEELETLGRSQRNALTSHWRVLLMHLLKWEVQSERRTRSWLVTIDRERREVRDLENENPSLRAIAADLTARAFKDARKDAILETDLPPAAFPAALPYSLEALRDEAFFPGPPATGEFAEILARLAADRSTD